MNLIEFRAENFARLKAVEIRPDGALVPITGKNSQGKTSILKAIWTLIEGRAAAPAVAIRKGQAECTLYGDLGAYKITRTIRKADDGESWDLKVVAADGTRITKSPQAVINAFKGDIGFDPLGWTRQPAKDQAAALRSLVKYDFDLAAKQRKEAYDKRTNANRRSEDEKAIANGIELPAGPKPRPVDISAKLDEMQRAAAHNAAVDREAASRRQRAQQAEADLDEAERLRARASTLEKAAEQVLRDLEALPAVEAPVDVAALRAEVDAAQSVAKVIDLHDKRDAHRASALMWQKLSDDMTDIITEIDKRQHDAIAAARLPVKGLSLGEDAVMLNGLPLAQAGTAEKLETALAIAMAKNPDLKVILVDEGSELDSEAMEFVAGLAEKNGFQVWIAKVDESREVGFVIEDGRIAT